MKTSFRAAAAALVVSCATAAPASAASIVQGGTDEAVGFAFFDPSLGTLDSVTLSLDVSQPRDWVVIAPGDGGSRTVSYDLAGGFDLQLFSVSAPLTSQSVTMPLTTGPQSQTVSLTPDAEPSPFFDGPSSSGVFTVTFTGSALFELDAAMFIRALSGDPFDRVYYDLHFSNFYAVGPDDADIFGPIQVGGGPSQLVLYQGCGDGQGETFEEYCGGTGITLTYNYTPFSAGAVPEPGTWAMMLLGFGAIGFQMRRRRPVVALRTA